MNYLFDRKFARARYSTVRGALEGYDLAFSRGDVAFFKKEDRYMVLFRCDNGWLSPLVAQLVHFGVIDGGCEANSEYVSGQMELLPPGTTVSFVGECVGAANALEAFVRLSPKSLEMVDEVYLRQFTPLNEKRLKDLLEKDITKVRLM